VDEASWLVGDGLLAPDVQGQALRSLAAPGTAYDDPVLGKDAQPAHMDGFVRTRDDNGGIHLNSGIPGHAFYLLATNLGGHVWERAAHIWYDAVTGPPMSPETTFSAFAAATVAAAKQRFGTSSGEAAATRRAWLGVGVTPRRPRR
jgi:Zn-dependent metalloprotease